MEKRKTLLLFFISFAFVTLFSRSTSFLYAFEGFDAAIFKQMGLAVLQGKTLYLDYFDNKGCLLYFIQALGLFLGGNFCILMLQAVTLTVTLVIWDKIISFYHQGRRRYLCLGVALLLLLCFYEGGDLSEEWCLPFASYPIYLYFRYLKANKVINPLEMFLVGVCFGIIAFVRINNASVFLGFFLYLFFTFLQKKEYRRFFADASLIVAGICLITVLCVLYFYLKAGWSGVDEMIYGTFLSYVDYFGYQFKPIASEFGFYFLTLGICIAFLCLHAIRQKSVWIPAMISYGLFILSSGMRCFAHYLMAALPLFVVGLAIIDVQKYRKTNRILAIVMVVPIAYYLVRPIGFFVHDLILNKESFKTCYSEFHRCIEKIPEAERDSIYNYNLSGVGAGMMQHEGLLQCNRVLYSPLSSYLSRLHREEVSKPFSPPKWVMITKDKPYYANDVAFIIENYEWVDSFDHDAQYVEGWNVGESLTVLFYRRKE